MRKSATGFTLIELIVTVAIVGLLASAAFPLASMAVRRQKETELRLALRDIRGAIDAYKRAGEQGSIEVKADESGYPPNLEVLVNGVEDRRNPESGVMIYFLRRLPRDPFYPDGSASASESWGLRSYASPPEAPQPGEDVFDVYSLSTSKGMNGVPYREW